MPLTAGHRLGQYEVIAPLGSGGMGEVYRARDTKLNREVAIKVLPDRLAQDPAALARFEREAQAIAALSHSNILAIHDFANENGVVYAVTELLDGDNLRARLADGALPVRKAVDYGVHIVHGIAAAHERGIVHRDLKPENIFITRTGVIKILDFGLAKTSKDSGPDGGETKIAETTPGMVMGTVGYMSPEQVRGLALDHRTDIFSFGAILYEMLTGRRPFKGESHVETMNAILKEDPPEFSEINANLPGSLERIIRRCLEKRPDDRFHSAHDLGIALEALSGATGQSSAAVAAAMAGESARRSRQLSLPLAAAAILVVGAAAFFAGSAFQEAEPQGRTDFQRLTYRRGPIWSAAIAPDGATFLYSAVWEGSPLQVYSTRSESPESAALPYVNADVASISSKGELAIISNRRGISGYSRVGTLARAPLSGGALRDVLEDVQHADWLPDGSDFAVSHLVGDKYRLEFPVGKVIYETTGWISHISVSRDGTRVAFLDQPIVGDDRGSPAIIDASGRKQSLPIECESAQGIAWAPGDREVWFTCASRGLWRALLAATPDGKVRTVLQVPGSLLLGDISADGTVLLSHDSARRGAMALPPGETRERDLSWLDWTQPMMLSGDGRTLLIAEEGEGGGPGYGTFLRKTDGSPAVRLGSGEGLALSPDGRWVIAQRLDPAPAQLVLMATGAGQTRALTDDDITHVNARFLPDGKRFLFNGFKPEKPTRVWIQDIDGGVPTPITSEGVVGLAIAPDGSKFIGRDGSTGARKLYAIPPAGASPANASEPEPLKFVEATDAIVQFTQDGRGLFLRKRIGTTAAEVIRLDLTTGARTLVRTITAIPEAVSQGGIGQLLLSADASSYVYGYGVTHSDLFLVKGLR